MNVIKSGEFEIIDRLTKLFPKTDKDLIVGPGDDCAVFKFNSNYYLLATCDNQVEGVHFSLNNSPAFQIGQKALAVNISDIAAMGGKPTFCLVSLILPESVNDQFLDDLYHGILSAGKNFGVQIAGGNITRGKEFSIDIFLLGQVKKTEILLRSGAQVGDKILVTGMLGEAAAGLALLKNKNITIEDSEKENLINKQKSPIPRLKEAQTIANLKTTTAMLDISDGLSSDLLHLCTKSDVGVEIWEDTLPISEEVKKVAKQLNQNLVDFALSGGEDYELLFTAPPKRVKEITEIVKKKTGTHVTIIGEILPKKDGRWVKYKYGERKQLFSTGWDHLK